MTWPSSASRRVLDLLTHYPRQGRYIDGTRLVPIAELEVGDKASVLGQVTRVSRPSSGYGRGRRRSPSRVEVEIADNSGRLKVVFFNQAWRAKQLAVGTLALFFGTISSYRDALQLASPTAEVLRTAGDEAEPDEGSRSGRVFPVYPLTEKANLTSARISRYVGEALDRAGRFADPRARSMAPAIRSRRPHRCLQPHPPAVVVGRDRPARRRLAFDELFRLQLALVLRKPRLQEDARGIRHTVSGPTALRP